MVSGHHSVTFSYLELTAATRWQITQLMAESRRRGGVEGRVRHEWAYGVYMGWRAQVMARAEPGRFKYDDMLFESLLDDDHRP